MSDEDSSPPKHSDDSDEDLVTVAPVSMVKRSRPAVSRPQTVLAKEIRTDMRPSTFTVRGSRLVAESIGRIRAIPYDPFEMASRVSTTLPIENPSASRLFSATRGLRRPRTKPPIPILSPRSISRAKKLMEKIEHEREMSIHMTGTPQGKYATEQERERAQTFTKMIYLTPPYIS
jgi:hypothetical protein